MQESNYVSICDFVHVLIAASLRNTLAVGGGEEEESLRPATMTPYLTWPPTQRQRRGKERGQAERIEEEEEMDGRTENLSPWAVLC